MKSYLLTWNPKYFAADRMEEIVDQRGSIYMHWSTNCMKIEADDFLYLMRQGKEPRGIVAVGQAHKHRLYMHQDGRWYVAVIWEWSRCEEPILTLDECNSLWPDQHWSPRGSGIQIKPPVDDELNTTILKMIYESGVKYNG